MENKQQIPSTIEWCSHSLGNGLQVCISSNLDNTHADGQQHWCTCGFKWPIDTPSLTVGIDKGGYEDMDEMSVMLALSVELDSTRMS